jgi:pyrroline-5-carboxylate reductase
MPNLPAAIGEGATAVALGEGARPGDEALAMRIFGAIGPVVERIDERLMDAFTAVAGSGPAYLFYLAEAMSRSAVALGFEPAAADRMVRQTLAGAALLLRGSAESPAALRGRVTSKGGTTEAAVNVLDGAGAMGAIERAVAAAEKRGRELGGQGSGR